MKIKLDENLPATIVELLTTAGHDVDTVAQQGLTGKEDRDVWQAAQKSSRFFITQDLDFSDSRSFKPGTHSGLLLVRVANPGRNELRRRLEQIFRTEAVESWQGCLVIATDRKVRVRRPPS